MVCNLLLAGGKIAVGVLTGSVAITADGMNNLSDASSNIDDFFISQDRKTSQNIGSAINFILQVLTCDLRKDQN